MIIRLKHERVITLCRLIRSKEHSGAICTLVQRDPNELCARLLSHLDIENVAYLDSRVDMLDFKFCCSVLLGFNRVWYSPTRRAHVFCAECS